MLWWSDAQVLGPRIKRDLKKGKSEMYSPNMTCHAKPGSCHSYYAFNFVNIMFIWKKRKEKPVLVVIAHQYESPIISIKLISLFLKSIQNRSLKWVWPYPVNYTFKLSPTIKIYSPLYQHFGLKRLARWKACSTRQKQLWPLSISLL